MTASRIKCEDWLGQLVSLHKTISMSGTGREAEKKRHEAYRFFIFACKLQGRLLDRYASAAGLEAVAAHGVDRVSISGAKGKRLLGQEWDLPEMAELRRWRSSVESLMFVLKHAYRFGQLGRRGLDAVRRELTEKVLAYNLDRLILLRKRKQEAATQPQAA